MTDSQMTDEELAAEAAKWADRKGDLTGWVDTPTAVPRHKESVSISMRVPRRMLEILRKFAEREGIGYQVLMKKWLDERIRREAVVLNRNASVIAISQSQVYQQAASCVPSKALILQLETDKDKDANA